MLNYIYEWMQNIAYYLVIVVAVLQMAGEGYKKYIRFFAGLILILMLSGPIFQMFGMTGFQEEQYRGKLEEIEQATGYLKDLVREGEDVGE